MQENCEYQMKDKYNSIPFIILLGSLTIFDPLSIDMYLSAFPEIAKTFAVKISSVELSLSIFFIGLALGQLIYGPLADVYGRKKPLIIGMLLYSLASLGCAFSTSIEMFIFFRCLQALGGCAGMVITRAIVSDVYDKKQAANIFSMLMLVMGVAPILAPLIGGYLTKFFGWRTIFEVLSLFSLISILCTSYFLPETHKKTESIDAVENKFLAKIRDYIDLLRDPSFSSYAISGGLMRAAMFAYIAGSPFVFITLFKVPAENYGWLFGSNAVGIIAFSQINRLLLRKFSTEDIFKNVIYISGIFAIILFINSIFFSNIIAIIIPLFLLIASLGLIFPNSAALALANQGHRAGTASALLGTLQWSIAFFSSFLVSMFHTHSAIPMTATILGFTLLAIICLKRMYKFQ